MTDTFSRQKWFVWSEITRLVDTARGLALLAEHDCAAALGVPEERDSARQAPMTAAGLLLKQAKDMLAEIEPNTNSEGTKS